jgi:acetate CoA/acetoacetate CoA-transferase alpha subunit
VRDKVMAADAAIGPLESGMTVALGGFLSQGLPVRLIDAVVASPVDDLTVYCNDSGWGDAGAVQLVLAGKVRKLVCCYIGATPALNAAADAGSVELCWTPQGTLLEQLRCGGAGLGGFLTPTGVGTVVADGKECVMVDGRPYLWEKAVRADVALVHAHAGDVSGNLRHRGTSRNYNTVVATCADHVVAEVERLCPVGDIDPESVHTPAILVDAVVPLDQGQARVATRQA